MCGLCGLGGGGGYTLFYFQNRLKLNFNHAPTVYCNSKIKSYTLRFETRVSDDAALFIRFS